MPKVYVNIIDPKMVSIRVVNEFGRPSEICKKYGAQVGWNGANWDRLTGQVDQNSYSFMTFPDRSVCVGENNLIGGWIFTSSIVRPLLADGVIMVPENSSNPTYYEVHARSGIGITADGKLIHVTVDGDFIYEGVTLWQLAKILHEFGAVNGGDQGGGGDSVEVLDGIVQSVPDDNGYERKVPQSILIFSEEDMPAGTIGSSKGVAFAKTNIKTYGGVLKVAIGIGDLFNAYVYGTLNSAKTDLIEFDHYYKSNGTRVELGEVCKCVTQNMKITQEQEPTGPVDPPPPSGTLPTLHLRADGYPDIDWIPNG